MATSVNATGEIQEDDGDFRQFDVVSDDSDHSYSNWSQLKGGKTTPTDTIPRCFTNTSSAVYKKIMKDWRVLERNLPDSIYVRVYERRIELLRAVIVGPAGTPYHDGLFFFDILFPSDYPTQPPMVHFRSYGLRLNPNLYANGFVCLSLLNTWYGKKSEKWNPEQSTVLQVLISIQGLVLNTEPYYNEPGIGFFTGSTKKFSLAYSEKAFLLSCKIMVYLLRRPPKNFEAFVVSHFRDRAAQILAACSAYRDGRAIAGCNNEIEAVASGKSTRVSKKFKVMMNTWYPEMVVAFSNTGASIGNFVEQLMVEKKTATSAPGATASITQKKTNKVSFGGALSIKKTKSGFRKVIGKLRRLWD